MGTWPRDRAVIGAVCVHPVDVAVGSGRLALWFLGACYLAVVLDGGSLPGVCVLPWQDRDVLALAEMSRVMDCASACLCRRCCCRERCRAGFAGRAAAGHRGSTRPRILRFRWIGRRGDRCADDG